MDLLDSTPAGEQNQSQNWNRGGERVVVSGGPVLLEGMLNGPPDARAIVVFAYDRMAQQENIEGALTALARVDQQAGFVTLSVNLLTPEDEALDRSTGFFRENVEVLHQRVIGIANWLIDNASNYQGISIGYFGVGVSGAAILAAAEARPDAAHAIVAIDPRTDLVRSKLSQVATPTLLIAGEDNSAAAQRSREALSLLSSDTTLDSVAGMKELGLKNRLLLIQGISNIFDNQQALQTVGQQASEWFTKHLM